MAWRLQTFKFSTDSELVAKVNRHRRVVPGTTGKRGGALRRREVPDSGHLQLLRRPPSTKVISKRMAKKQQMRWTPRGAHLLLQIRTRVLNDELATDFHRWYPGFVHTADRQALADLPQFVPLS